eukprot:1098604_1
MSSNSSKPDYHTIEANDWINHNKKYPNDTVLAVADGTLFQTASQNKPKHSVSARQKEMIVQEPILDHVVGTRLIWIVQEPILDKWYILEMSRTKRLCKNHVEKGGKKVMIISYFNQTHKLDQQMMLFEMRKQK